MAEYIENVLEQTSKLDWAMPFQRTGAFPLDRSTLFSSLADAQAYAKGDGSDERSLGGAAYVGQVISVFEGGVATAYLIANKGVLTKLAATTSTGDLAADIVALQGALASLTDDVKANKTALENVYTKSETDTAISVAVTNANHLKRKVVGSVDEVEADKDNADALQYIYMVKTGLESDDNKYREYIVVEDESGNRSVEKVGDWEVDLSDYAKTEDVNKELAKKADSDKVYTKEQADQAISEAIDVAIGEDAPSEIKKELDEYKASNDIAVKKNADAIDANSDKIAALEKVGAEKNVITSVSSDFAVSDLRELSLNNISIAKVTNLQDTLDGYSDRITTLESAINTTTTGLKDRVTSLETKISNLEDTYVTINDFNTVIGSLEDMKTTGRKVLEDIDTLQELMTWKNI